MTILAANYSTSLAQLLEEENVPIAVIEVGPWFTVAEISQYQQDFSKWDFYFHPGNWTSRLALSPRSMSRLKAYLACTQSPWASVHIALLPPGYVWLAMRFGLYLPPPPNPERAMRWFIKQARKLKEQIDIPLILENMPSFPTQKYLFETDPGLICQILEETKCEMLLDLAHARVAASIHGLDIMDYLGQFPLEKVVQIHISGPRRRNGYLHDAHEPLEADDYALLKWVLNRTDPEVLTLEYFRGKEPLYEQLTELAKIVNP